MRAAGDTGVCSHSRGARREQSQRLAESERYHNSCHQLPRHCEAIESWIVWDAHVAECLFQFSPHFCQRVLQDGTWRAAMSMAVVLHAEMNNG